MVRVTSHIFYYKCYTNLLLLALPYLRVLEDVRDLRENFAAGAYWGRQFGGLDLS